MFVPTKLVPEGEVDVTIGDIIAMLDCIFQWGCNVTLCCSDIHDSCAIISGLYV